MIQDKLERQLATAVYPENIKPSIIFISSKYRKISLQIFTDIALTVQDVEIQGDLSSYAKLIG